MRQLLTFFVGSSLLSCTTRMIQRYCPSEYILLIYTFESTTSPSFSLTCNRPLPFVVLLTQLFPYSTYMLCFHTFSVLYNKVM